LEIVLLILAVKPLQLVIFEKCSCYCYI